MTEKPTLTTQQRAALRQAADLILSVAEQTDSRDASIRLRCAVWELEWMIEHARRPARKRRGGSPGQSLERLSSDSPGRDGRSSGKGGQKSWP